MKNENIKYFYDCEFLEGPQKKSFLGIPFGKTKSTIDLISIGIVSSHESLSSDESVRLPIERSYYAISKEFNLKEAWNRYQMKQVSPDDTVEGTYSIKEYWIRENVLKPIFLHFIKYELAASFKMEQVTGYGYAVDASFTFKNFKRLLKKYGKSWEEIRWELTKFILDPNDEVWSDWLGSSDSYWDAITKQHYTTAELYGYYSAYDHVCLAWIYGKMIDLPDGIPMYTKDLKQIVDDKVEAHLERWGLDITRFEDGLKKLKETEGYPTQDNAHDALDDAKWNKKLYEFLNNLK